MSSVNSEHSGGSEETDGETFSIVDQPYCTHECLLGLTQGHPLDPQCPNVGLHASQHLNLVLFQELVQAQMAEEANTEADQNRMHLFAPGARGSCVKIRLKSLGYTFVAKGMELWNQNFLEHERDMYAHLSDIQGKHIPVCMGMIPLTVPYIYGRRWNCYLLLLSYGGRPLLHFMSESNHVFFRERAVEALAKLHERHLIHGDPWLRNFTWDEAADRLMVIDFDRSALWVEDEYGDKKVITLEQDYIRENTHHPEEEFYQYDLNDLKDSVKGVLRRYRIGFYRTPNM